MRIEKVRVVRSGDHTLYYKVGMPSVLHHPTAALTAPLDTSRFMDGQYHSTQCFDYETARQKTWAVQGCNFVRILKKLKEYEN